MLNKLDSVIAELVNQINYRGVWFEEARRDRSETRMEACRAQSVTLKYALGLVLVVREKGRIPQDFEAIATANTYLSS